MAMLEIQTRNDLPSYEQQVVLDGTSYTIGLYFNPRMNDGNGAWMILLADKNRNLIIAPVPVVVNWPLFDRFVGRAIPPGTVFAFDTAGNNADPGQFDLGDRVRLYYLEQGS